MSRITAQVMIEDGGLQGTKSWAKARKVIPERVESNSAWLKYGTHPGGP